MAPAKTPRAVIDQLHRAVVAASDAELKAKLAESGIELEETRDTLLRGGGAAKEAREGELVCSCHDIGQGNLEKLLADNCPTFESFTGKTNAGSGCGSCRPALSRLWQQHLSRVERMSEVAVG